MTLSELKQYLESIGFKTAINPLASEFNKCDWYAYKWASILTGGCECNSGKSLQILITPCSITHQNYSSDSVEIEVCGKYIHWWRLQAYGVSFDDLVKNFPDIEARLIRAWNALGKS